MILFGIVLF